MFRNSLRSLRSAFPKVKPTGRNEKVTKIRGAIVERLEDRTLLSYTLTGGNLFNGSVEVASNVASFQVGRSGFAYFQETNQAFFINEGPSPADNFSLGNVYMGKYGVRSDGNGYFWNEADNKLYLNTASSEILLDSNPIFDFGLRSDGQGYFWDSVSGDLYINSVSANTLLNGGNPIIGFAMRSDGDGVYWDKSTSELFYNSSTVLSGTIDSNAVLGMAARNDNTIFYFDSANHLLWKNSSGTTSTQAITDPILGLGRRSDGAIVYWDAINQNAYYWLSAMGSGAQIGSTPMLGFGVRSAHSPNTDGVVYLWQSSDQKLYIDTPTTYTLLDPHGTGVVNGFAMRSDGYGAYWDQSTHNVYIDFNGTESQIDTTTMQGFGGTSNGNLYLWRSDGNLFIDAPTTYTPLGAVSAFASDSSGIGYYVPTGTTTVHKNTPTVDNGINFTYIGGLQRDSLGAYGVVSFTATAADGNTAVFFEPLFGNPTVSTGTGPELTSSTVKEYVIYWGAWSSPPSGPNEAMINSGLSGLYSSNYFKALKQYNSSITGNVTLAGTWNDTIDTLGTTFADTQLQTVVENAISANGWPTTTVAAAANSAIYMVITPPGHTSSTMIGDSGYHWSVVNGSSQIVYGWLEDGALSTQGSLANVLTEDSHETAESISDPLGNVPGKTGITETASTGIDWLLAAFGFTSPLGELADFEPNVLSDILNWTKGTTSVWAQAYWSKNDLAYIVET